MIKFSEVKLEKALRVRDMDTDPFEGVYLGSIEGNHGLNYRFFSEDRNFVVYGTKALHEKMAQIQPGYAVRIAKIAEHDTKSGGTFIEIKVEVSDDPVPGFDVEGYSQS